MKTWGDRLKKVDSPLEQARNYAPHAVRLLERDVDLVQPIASPHGGKCLVPFGYGVVLTNITRSTFEREGLGEAIAHCIACFPLWVNFTATIVY